MPLREPNDGQRLVIETLTGDLFVSAGAGSGKTFALARRFVRAVAPPEDAGWSAADLDAVLTITFTDKAAGELLERIRRALLAEGRVDLARRVDESWVSTIHGLCSRILRRHALEAGLDPRFRVLDQVEAGVLGHEAFERAARQLLDHDGVSRLLEDYGLATVRDGVLDAHGRIAAMGSTVPELRLAEETALGDAVREAEERLAALAAEHDSLRETATVAANKEAVARLRVVLADAGGDAGAVRDACDGFKVAARGADEVKDIAEQCREAARALEDAACAEIATEYALAFATLLGSYDDAFRTLKEERGVLDFDDLQARTALLFESRPEVAARYRERFRLVMVDEFQDTDELQTRVIKPLANDDLCTVGDDKQAIYSFRYADVEVFRRLAAEMRERGAARAELDVNYRSHGDILAFVNAAFGSDVLFDGDLMPLKPGRTGEVSRAWPAGAPRVELLLVPEERDGDRKPREAESEAIADRVAGLVASGVPASDIVVLFRAKGPIDVYATALRDRGVDVFVAAETGFFDRAEVALARALARVLANPRDDEALALVLESDEIGVSDDALYLLRERAGRGALWEGVTAAQDLSLPEEDAARLARLTAAVGVARRTVATSGLGEGMTRLFADVDLDLALLRRPDGRRAWANASKVARIAAEYERAFSADARGFVEYLRQRETHARAEPGGAVVAEGDDAVRMMTQHAAKGLEFPVVVVPELGRRVADRTPPFLVSKTPDGPRLSLRLPKRDDDRTGRGTRAYEEARAEARRREIEEEQRLLYVACTRAEEALLLSGVTKPDKLAEDRPVTWLREALGVGPVERLEPRVLECGALVALRVAERAEPPRRDGTEAAPPEPTSRHETSTGDAPRANPAIAAGPPDPAERAGADAVSTAADTVHRTARANTPTVPDTLSYSGIAEYESCPYRYYSRRFLGLGTLPPLPEPGAADPLAIGTAVHAALQLRADGLLDDGRTAAVAVANGLDDDARTRLCDAVEAYAASDAASRAEGMRDAGGSVVPEAPFAIPVTERTLLVGTMDLLARLGDEALVVDYKTGDPDERVGLDARYRTQAECYALAALRGGAARVDVRFVLVERGGECVDFSFDAEDEPRLVARVRDVLARMASGEFAPLDAYDAGICRDCPAIGGTCPVSSPRRGMPRAAPGADRTRR